MEEISPSCIQFTKTEKLLSHESSTGLGAMNTRQMSSSFDPSTIDEGMADAYSETSSHTAVDRYKHKQQATHDGRINQTEAENKPLYQA